MVDVNNDGGANKSDGINSGGGGDSAGGDGYGAIVVVLIMMVVIVRLVREAVAFCVLYPP